MHSMFLQLGKIEGESTVDKFEKQIEVHSFSHGFSQPTSPLPSSMGGGTTSRAYHNYLTFSKHCDKSSPNIMKALWQGKTFDGTSEKVIFTCTRADEQKPVDYLVITLKNVIIASYEINGGGDIPSETFSLNYSSIEYKYVQQDKKGGIKGNVAASHDLATNTVA